MQQHLFRWNRQYQYSEVRWMGRSARYSNCQTAWQPVPAQQASSPLAGTRCGAQLVAACKQSDPQPGLHPPPPASSRQVTALGIVSIFDQILGGLPEAEREAVFTAFISALEEDPAQYRKGGWAGSGACGTGVRACSAVRRPSPAAADV